MSQNGMGSFTKEHGIAANAQIIWKSIWESAVHPSMRLQMAPFLHVAMRKGVYVVLVQRPEGCCASEPRVSCDFEQVRHPCWQEAPIKIISGHALNKIICFWQWGA